MMDNSTNNEQLSPTGYNRPDPQREYAGFWIRLLALFLDGLAMQTVFVIMDFALGYKMFEPPLGMSVIQSLLSIIYYVVMTVIWGQTLGKRAVGIQVIRQNGEPNSWGNIILREVVGKFVSGIILFIGYMMAGWDREKRALHDQIAGTRVVKKVSK